jgi:hypothetical protein
LYGLRENSKHRQGSQGEKVMALAALFLFAAMFLNGFSSVLTIACLVGLAISVKMS